MDRTTSTSLSSANRSWPYSLLMTLQMADVSGVKWYWRGKMDHLKKCSEGEEFHFECFGNCVNGKRNKFDNSMSMRTPFLVFSTQEIAEGTLNGPGHVSSISCANKNRLYS